MTSEFERTAFVWCENESGSRADQLAQPPSVGVANWPHVLPCDALRWREGQMPDLSGYDTLLLNLFHTEDSTHAAQIRRAYPDKLLVAMPDANLELVLMQPQWENLWDQIGLCDVIGGRTPQDCAVYGAFFDKPTVWLPSPIYPLSHFAALRDTPKEAFILTQDHTMHPGLFAQNVAALALIQRATGLRVVYTAARPLTPVYADKAGLKAEFTGSIPFEAMTQLTAKAALCVDLYMRHSYWRQGILAAAVGTPTVGSDYTLSVGHPKVHPLNPKEALRAAVDLLNDPEYYEEIRQRGFAVVEREFGVDACRRRVRQLITGYAKATV